MNEILHDWNTRRHTQWLVCATTKKINSVSDFISLHAERQKKKKPSTREREKKIGHSVCTCEEQLRKAQKIKAEWHIRKASLLLFSVCFKGMEVTCGRPTCFSGVRACDTRIRHQREPHLVFYPYRNFLPNLILRHHKSEVILIYCY